MVELERRGVATAAVATEPFLDEALEQARVLGMPDYRMVYIPHPVQLLTLEELHAQADAAPPRARATSPTRSTSRSPVRRPRPMVSEKAARPAAAIASPASSVR